MARPLRVEFEGAWYHGMNRGAARRRVFLSTVDFIKFLDLLGDVSEIHAVEIHAYCLMGNHYHLLVRTPDANLGRAMRHLNGVYTQYFNRRTGRDGPLFRGRYRSILVDSDAYLLQASRYIHLNPVDAGEVDRPDAYPHSSYRAYLDPKQAPRWLVTRIVLGHFGARNPHNDYRRFVEEGIDAETRAFHEQTRTRPVLGRSRFKEDVRARIAKTRHGGSREVPDARRLRSRPSLPTIAHSVRVAFGVDVSALSSAGFTRNPIVTLARSSALYLARHEAGASLTAIAAWMGYRSYNSAATALTRFRRRLDDPVIRDRLRKARALMYKVET